MPYSKSFPRTIEGSAYPRWEEVYLTDAEEKEAEAMARKENIDLMRESIKDAKEVFKTNSLKDYQTDIIQLAISLFEKRASHSIYWKEMIAKEKFDKGKK